MQETMGSKEAQERLDEFMGGLFYEFYEFFCWGYDAYQGNAHSWEAGRKHGYWLTTLERYDRVHTEMQKVRKAAEALDFVEEVEVYDYEPEEAALYAEEKFKGEQWVFSFVPEITLVQITISSIILDSIGTTLPYAMSA